jgi:hypothetical protein
MKVHGGDGGTAPHNLNLPIIQPAVLTATALRHLTSFIAAACVLHLTYVSNTLVLARASSDICQEYPRIETCFI